MSHVSPRMLATPRILKVAKLFGENIEVYMIFLKPIILLQNNKRITGMFHISFTHSWYVY